LLIERSMTVYVAYELLRMIFVLKVPCLWLLSAGVQPENVCDGARNVYSTK